MNLQQQILANVADSKITTFVGLGLIVAGILCDSGVTALYLSPTSNQAWCAALGKLAEYVGGAGLLVSRSPTTPPRQ